MSEIATLEGLYSSLGLAGHKEKKVMSKRSFGRLPPPLALSDIEDLGFLGEIIPYGAPKAAGLSALGGAAFGFLWRVALNQGHKLTQAEVDAAKTADPKFAGAVGGWKPLLGSVFMQAAAPVVGGIVLGRLAWMVSRDMALGILGGAGAAIGEGAYRVLFSQPEQINGAANTDWVARVRDLSVQGLGYGHTEDQSLLGDAEVLDQNTDLLGFGDVEVSERASGAIAELGSWLS